MKRGLLGWIDRRIQCATQVLRRGDPRRSLRVRYLVLVALYRGLGGDGLSLHSTCPSAFLPTEDQNYLICIVQAPPGASLTYTSDLADRAVKVIRQNKDVYGTFAVMGFSLSGGSSSNYGLIFVPLKSVNQRVKEGKGHSAAAIFANSRPKLFGVPGALS